MNAQEKWKLYYINFCRTILFKIGKGEYWRMNMRNFRREAALERKLETAQRTIEAQARQLEELGKAYDRMRNTVMDFTP